MLLQEPMVLSEEVNHVYIRMDRMTDLPTYLEQHSLTQEETVRMMLGLCRTLTSFEEKGIVHRDIKPENIHIDENGHIRLGDFGLSTERNEELSARGTPAYMAPEVYHGKSFDYQSDLYSLGLVFYEMMNDGRAPFTDPGKQILSPHDRMTAFERRMKGDSLPEPVQAQNAFGLVLVKACAPDPRDRYQSAKALMNDLERLLNGELKEGRFRERRLLSPLPCLILLALLLFSAAFVFISTDGKRIPFGPYAYASLSRTGTLVISGRGPARYMHKNADTEETEKSFSSARKIVVKEGISMIDLSGAGYDKTDSLEIDALHFPQVEEVILPAGLKKIASRSFIGMPSLKSIRIPDTVEEIGQHAFLSCRSLEEVTLPAKLKRLGESAFSSCLNLENINFGGDVEEFPFRTFEDTAWLDKAGADREYLIVNGYLMRYQGEEGVVRIPESLGIHTIGEGAFEYNKRIRELILPDSIKKIDSGAFRGCENMVRIRLPEGLSKLPEEVFENCTSLEEVRLPSGLSDIGGEAFLGCTSLKDVSLPDSISFIGPRAFYGTPFLAGIVKDDYAVVNGILLAYYGSQKHLRIPGKLNLVGIAGWTFNGCKELESVVLPEGIEWLGEGCFGRCYSLKDISFPHSLIRIDGGSEAFHDTAWSDQGENQTMIIVNQILIACSPKGKKLAITNDLNIKSLADGSLSLLQNPLEELWIGDQVVDISEDLFGGTDSDKNISKIRLPKNISPKKIKECFGDTLWYELKEYQRGLEDENEDI